MATSLVYLAPDTVRTATVTGTAAATGFPLDNATDGTRNKFYKTNAAVTVSQLDFDQGAASTVQIEYCYVARADILRRNDTAAVQLKVYGDDNSGFSSPESFTTTFNLGDLQGPGSDDFVFETAFTTAYRYHRIEFTTTASFNHVVSKAWVGTYVDLGREPFYPKSITKRIAKRDKRREPYSLEYRYSGITNEKREEFQSKIGNYPTSPLVLYVKSGTAGTASINSNELIPVLLDGDAQFSPVSADHNDMTVAFKEQV